MTVVIPTLCILTVIYLLAFTLCRVYLTKGSVNPNFTSALTRNWLLYYFFYFFLFGEIHLKRPEREDISSHNPYQLDLQLY